MLRILSTRSLHLTPCFLGGRVDRSKFPKVHEADLEEKFVKGWGPGGQAVNKTTNAVFLKHSPTGVWVKCHDSRSLDANRKLARKLLANKLDVHLNGPDSVEEQEKRLDSQRKEKKREKTRLKYEQRQANKQALSETGEVEQALSETGEVEQALSETGKMEQTLSASGEQELSVTGASERDHPGPRTKQD